MEILIRITKIAWQFRVRLIYHLLVSPVELLRIEIVNNDDLAVGGEMDVNLGRRRTYLPCQIDGCEGVFGRVVRGASMGNDQAFLSAKKR